MTKSKLSINAQCNVIIQCVSPVECLSVSSAGDLQEKYTAAGNHNTIIYFNSAITL